MKVYLAGSYVNRFEIRGYMEDLRKAGFEITQDWTYHTAKNFEFSKLKAFARSDLQGVVDCDIFILHFKDVSMGKAFEFGVAYVLNKPIYIIGEWDGFHCIFASLISHDNFFGTFDELLQHLKDTVVK